MRSVQPFANCNGRAGELGERATERKENGGWATTDDGTEGTTRSAAYGVWGKSSCYDDERSSCLINTAYTKVHIVRSNSSSAEF